MNHVSTQSNPSRSGLIKAVLLIAAFFSMLNETSMNVALSQFSELFQVSMSAIQWLTTGFMLVTTIVVPITAWILQRFTTRQIYFSAMVLLIVGALLSGTAQMFGVLLAGRMLQAVGSSFLLNLLIHTTLLLTPPHKRGAALGLVSLVVLFAPAISPTLSGLVLQALGWRWLFFGVVPFFGLTTAVGYFALRNLTEPRKLHIDLGSIVLSALAFGGILLGISNSTATASGILPVAGPLLVGGAGLALFCRRQLRLDQPLLELRVLKHRAFTLGALLNMVSVITIFGVIVMVPLYLERGVGLSVFVTGLMMLPGGLLNGVVSPIAGRIYDKYGPRPLVVPGFLVMILMALLFSTVTASTSLLRIVGIDCCILVGASMVMTPAQTNSLNQLPRSEYPYGTAIMNTMVQLAGSLGTALYISVFSISQQRFQQGADSVSAALQRDGLRYGFHRAFLFGAILLAVGLVCSLFVKASVPVGQGEQPDRGPDAGDEVSIRTIMKEQVYTTDASATVLEAMELMTDQKISGVPVTGRDGKVVGFLSDGDIMRYFAKHHPLFSNAFSLVAINSGEDSFDDKLRDLLQLNVMDIAVKNVITVRADADLGDVCQILSEHHLKKAPVMECGQMAAIINRSNITKYAIRTCVAAAEAQA